MAQNRHKHNELIQRVMNIKAYEVDTRQRFWNEGMNYGLKAELMDLIKNTHVGDKVKIKMEAKERGVFFYTITAKVVAKYKNLVQLEHTVNGNKLTISPCWAAFWQMKKGEVNG